MYRTKSRFTQNTGQNTNETNLKLIKNCHKDVPDIILRNLDLCVGVYPTKILDFCAGLYSAKIWITVLEFTLQKVEISMQRFTLQNNFIVCSGLRFAKNLDSTQACQQAGPKA
jgi:hypothetical protein